MKNKSAKQEKKIAAKKTGSAFYRGCYAVLSGLVGWVLRIHVTGHENEPDEGGFVVCANHVSASDAVVLCYAFRKHQVHLMAKKELFKIPILSGLIRMFGAFPVDRKGSDVSAIKTAVSVVKEGKCMGIFPQGHRYPGENPRDTEVKNGAALICTKANANVVPVYIKRKNNRAKLFRKTEVIIGKEIPFDSLEYNHEATGEYTRITNLIFDRICTLGEEAEKETK